MKYSIIVPIYKVEKYLPQCIESVLRQTFADFELILVDDGSPDNCGSVCKHYEASDKRVRIITRENGGLSAARNSGIAAARGEYLIFLDSDDYWINKNGLELIDRAASENAADAVFWLYKKVEENDNAFADGIPEDFAVDFVTNKSVLTPFFRDKRLVSCAWDVAVSKKLFENGKLDFEPGVYSEDVEWLARLIMCAESFAFAKLVLNAYRLRGSSITKNIGEKNLQDLNSHYGKIAGYIDSAGEDTASALKIYLGEQAANYILALASFESDAVKPYTESEGIRFIRFCKSKRARLVKASAGVFGVPGTVSLIKKLILKR